MDDRLSQSLKQLRQAAADAVEFSSGMDEAGFMADKRTQRAVVMSLMIVGETATQILERYPEYAARQPDVPWQNMRGMRNRIAHGYFDLDLQVVWTTVKTALPELLARTVERP